MHRGACATVHRIHHGTTAAAYGRTGSAYAIAHTAHRRTHAAAHRIGGSAHGMHRGACATVHRIHHGTAAATHGRAGSAYAIAHTVHCRTHAAAHRIGGTSHGITAGAGGLLHRIHGTSAQFPELLLQSPDNFRHAFLRNGEQHARTFLQARRSVGLLRFCGKAEHPLGGHAHPHSQQGIGSTVNGGIGKELHRGPHHRQRGCGQSRRHHGNKGRHGLAYGAGNVQRIQ